MTLAVNYDDETRHITSDVEYRETAPAAESAPIQYEADTPRESVLRK